MTVMELGMNEWTHRYGSRPGNQSINWNRISYRYPIEYLNGHCIATIAIENQHQNRDTKLMGNQVIINGCQINPCGNLYFGIN